MENSILDTSNHEGGNNNVSPWPIAQKWGLIGAAVAAILMLINYLTGGLDAEAMLSFIEDEGKMYFNMMGIVIWIIALIAYFFIYYSAIKEYREQLGGYITFGKAFLVSFFSVLIKILAYSVFIFIFYKFVLPGDFAEQMTEVAIASSELYGGGGEEAENMQRSIQGFIHSPTGALILSAGMTLIGGAILSLIAAAIGQKHRLS